MSKKLVKTFQIKEFKVQLYDDKGYKGDLIQFVSGENGEIILRKYYQTCVFCGGKKELYKFSDKLICEDCLRELMELVVKK